MKKIGLITFYKDNFGSILQCYAMKNKIEEYGFCCDVLDELKDKTIIYKIKQKKKRIYFILRNIIKDPKFLKKIIANYKKTITVTNETRKKMNTFVDKKINPKFYRKNEFVEMDSQYEAFIVGSDQVWNVNNDINELFFLGFTNDDKKNTFAISFGTDNPDRKFIKKLKKYIHGFKEISVREDSGVIIVKRFNNMSAVRIGDPTLLLSDKEWRCFCGKVCIEEENYILVHFLNTPNYVAIEYIKKLEKEKNIQVICIAYFYQVYDEMGWKYTDCGPEEYVSYIDKALYVCTDSYHTTLFSINLSSNFFVFNRQYINSYPQTSRIKDLLNRFGLSDRFIISDNEGFKNNIEINNEILSNERNIAKRYLKDVILSKYEG